MDSIIHFNCMEKPSSRSWKTLRRLKVVALCYGNGTPVCTCITYTQSNSPLITYTSSATPTTYSIESETMHFNSIWYQSIVEFQINCWRLLRVYKIFSCSSDELNITNIRMTSCRLKRNELSLANSVLNTWKKCNSFICRILKPIKDSTYQYSDNIVRFILKMIPNI